MKPIATDQKSRLFMRRGLQATSLLEYYFARTAGDVNQGILVFPRRQKSPNRAHGFRARAEKKANAQRLHDRTFNSELGGSSGESARARDQTRCGRPEHPALAAQSAIQQGNPK